MPVAIVEEQGSSEHGAVWPQDSRLVWANALQEQLTCPLPRWAEHLTVEGRIGKAAFISPVHIERILQQIVLASRLPEAKNSFDQDVAYYRQNPSRFLDKYRGKYIAIINKRVVDEDRDFSELARRVFQKHGYRDIFMPKVTEKERVVHIPTPFLERSSSGSI